MKILLFLLFMWMPLRHESNLEVYVACRTPEIFSNYRNFNFKQEISDSGEGLRVKIKSQTLSFKNLNNVISTDERYLSGQDPLIREVFSQIRQNVLGVGDFLQNISIFLKNHIAYSEENLPQDAVAVILNRKANCIGYANVAQALLACGGIVSRPVNGFFLREKKSLIEPVPHRWLEIDLPGEFKVFYDPQYQDFSSRYLVTNFGIPLNQIERFQGVIVKKSKKLLDE